MRPYLATIMDSLREAVASRVLWIVLGLISLLLLLLAPLGYREELSTGLLGGDIRDSPGFLFHFREEAKKEEPSPARHIWLQLDEKTRAQLENLKIPGQDEDMGSPMEFGRAMGSFQKSIKALMEKPGFYDEESWKNVPLDSDEIGDLKRKKPDELTTKDQQRLNRLWLEAAFPDYIQVSPLTSVRFRYGWWNLGQPQPFREEQFIKLLKDWVAWVMNKFIGVIGVMVAILVTASIIPQMFDPGSLHLLLSKPVSRWLLFLSKFLGGCGFIGVAAAYLIGGLCLILAARFGVWDVKLLWSIPLYLFLFAIYYSVSALAGVIWRNAIVSIAVSVLFWFGCWVVGAVKSTWDTAVITKSRFASVFYGGETLMAVNEMGFTHFWNPEDKEWKEVFATREQRQLKPMYYMVPSIPRQFRPAGPVYDSEHDQLVISMFPVSRAQSTFYFGERNDKWEAKAAKSPPPIGTFQLVREPTGKVLAVSSVGLFRMEGDPRLESEPVKLFGLKLPLLSGGPFRSVGPEEPIVLTQPADVAVDGTTGTFLAYSRGTLSRLDLNLGKFTRGAERKFDTKDPRAALVAIGGKTVIVARDDGKIHVLDAESLETLHEFQPEEKNQPKVVSASPDGRWFTVIFHTGKLYVYDVISQQLDKAAAAGQGNISACSFSEKDQALVADRLDRVTKYELPSWKVLERMAPPSDVWTRAYNYAVLPLYTVFPKPGELDTTFRYVLFGQQTSGSEEADDDLSAVQVRLDPWTPLWSSAAFMVVVLGIACIYIEWQEF